MKGQPMIHFPSNSNTLTWIHCGFGGDFLTTLIKKFSSPHLHRGARFKYGQLQRLSAKYTEWPFAKYQHWEFISPKDWRGALAKANSAFSRGVFWVPLNSGSIKVVSRHLTICTHSRKRMHLNIFHAHCLICILTSRNQCVLYSLFQHTQHIYNIMSL